MSPDTWGNILAFRVDPGTVTLEQTFRACLQSEGFEGMLAKAPVTQEKESKAAKPVHGPSRAGSTTPVDNLVAVDFKGYLAWSWNFVRRHPAVLAVFVLVLLALVFAALRSDSASYRMSLLMLVEALAFGWLLVTGIGYTGTLARKVNRRLERQREAMANALARNKKEAAESLRRIENGAAGLAELAHRVAEYEKQATASTAELAHRVAENEKQATASTADLLRSIEEAKGVADRAEAMGKKLLLSAPTHNYARYRTFNRTLSDEQVDLLKNVWARRLSVPAGNRTLGYAAHRICMFESLMHGRLATTIEDIMLRTMVARAVSEKSVSVLEIGTLFGIGAIAVIDALRCDGRPAHLTVIDPLESYYGHARDIITGQVVSEDIFRDNLRVAGIPENDVTVIKGMSTTADTIAEAGKKTYDLLVIDGDHTYAGVKSDFDNYSGFVRQGGFIVFDDYGANDWPDVKKFVDSEMPNHSRFTPVGAEWRTAVFRVVGAADPA
jgi:cephalosporin hydroxylase